MYEKELRQLINNLLKEHRSTMDSLIWCPECERLMEFRMRDWHCLGRGCGFTIPRNELPGPDEIDDLIKEVKFERKAAEIKNIIREVMSSLK